jgi:DNA-binding transcriptional LysR family regulator
MDNFSDLAFFALLARHHSLAATAQQMGVTPPAVSKRLAALERRLGVRLLNRTTRRMSLTPEGELYLVDGGRVLAELATLERTLAGSRIEPHGLLRVGATLGFGRRHIAPLLSKFARRYPDVEVQLHLADRPLNLVEDAFDLVVRFGEQADARLAARRLARNDRVLCAAPAYLRKAGVPATPQALATHRCLFIREGDEAFGTWALRSGARRASVKVRGALSTNDGETALGWALDGQGVLMRSLWDAAAYLRSGRLQRVLPDWSPAPADVWLVFQPREALSPKTRALVDFLVEAFEGRRGKTAAPHGGW